MRAPKKNNAGGTQPRTVHTTVRHAVRTVA